MTLLATAPSGLDHAGLTPIRSRVRVPITFTPQALDKALKAVFDMDVPPVDMARFQSMSIGAQRAVEFTWRTAHIARSLLQAIKLPIYTLGHIETVVPVAGQAGEFEVTCQVPRIDHIDAAVIERCHAFALTLAQFFSVQTAGPKYDELLESIKTQFTEPLGKKMPGGKSTVPLLTIAHEKGIPFMHLGAGIYQVGWGKQALWMERSAFSSDSSLATKATHNKVLTAQLLGAAGLPVPRHQLVANPAQAIAAAQALGYPVVVKPADLDRGEGVTINLDTDQQVAGAFEAAAKLSKRVLVEKQAPGICHRITVVNGQTTVVVKRLPKAVVGDGAQTVRQLIDQANKAEKRKVAYKRIDLWPADDMAVECAQKAGYGFDDAPPKGAFVPLRPMESSAWGGNPEDATSQAHPANLQIAIEAARLLGLSVAGVDYITDDISVPWYESGGIINEVNYAPLLGIRLDYMRRRAEFLMDRLFPNQGRIPVHVYVGGPEASAQALQAQSQSLAKGTPCTVVAQGATRSPTGTKVQSFTVDNLYHRTKAALMDRTVESLIVVVNHTSVLDCGLPLDRIDTLHLIDRQLAGAQDPQKTDNLIQALEALCKS